MASQPLTPNEIKDRADEAIQENVDRLRELLVAAAGQLDPFPQFFGSMDVQAVEVDPPTGSGPDRGCVVICPDGELYELTVNFGAHPLAGIGGLEREEKVKKLDLPPVEYIAYAHNAVSELTKLLSRLHR